MPEEKPIRLAVDPKWVKKLEDIATVTTELTEVLTERVDKMPEVEEVKTVIVVSCAGKSIERVVYVNWWEKLSLEEIADTTAKIVKEIVGRGELEEGTI